MGAFTRGQQYAKTLLLRYYYGRNLNGKRLLYSFYCTTTNPPPAASPSSPGREFKGFFHPSLLQCSFPSAELSKIQSFEVRLHTESKLKDGEVFISSLSGDELGKSIPFIQRLQSQMDELYDPSQTSLLVIEALKRCHRLNNVDVALELFSHAVPGEGYLLSLKLLLDLLHRNEMYSTCVRIANDALDQKHVDKLSRWFYDISITAAFKMESREGLKMAAKFFDSLEPLEKAKGRAAPRHLMVLALYCVQQNAVNAGLHLLNQHNWGLNMREVNIRALAYLQRGDLDLAIHVLRKLNKDSLAATKSSGSKKQTRVLYHDVFKCLKAVIHRSSKLDAIVYLDTIHDNFNVMVSPWDLSALVVNSLRANYIKGTSGGQQSADNTDSQRNI